MAAGGRRGNLIPRMNVGWCVIRKAVFWNTLPKSSSAMAQFLVKGVEHADSVYQRRCSLMGPTASRARDHTLKQTQPYCEGRDTTSAHQCDRQRVLQN